MSQLSASSRAPRAGRGAGTKAGTGDRRSAGASIGAGVETAVLASVAALAALFVGGIAVGDGALPALHAALPVTLAALAVTSVPRRAAVPTSHLALRALAVLAVAVLAAGRPDLVPLALACALAVAATYPLYLAGATGPLVVASAAGSLLVPALQHAVLDPSGTPSRPGAATATLALIGGAGVTAAVGGLAVVSGRALARARRLLDAAPPHPGARALADAAARVAAGSDDPQAVLAVAAALSRELEHDGADGLAAAPLDAVTSAGPPAREARRLEVPVQATAPACEGAAGA